MPVSASVCVDNVAGVCRSVLVFVLTMWPFVYATREALWLTVLWGKRLGSVLSLLLVFNLTSTNMPRHGDLSALGHLPVWITKETIISTFRCFVWQRTCAPFHWCYRYAYLKLGVRASCQLESETIHNFSIFDNFYYFLFLFFPIPSTLGHM